MICQYFIETLYEGLEKTKKKNERSIQLIVIKNQAPVSLYLTYPHNQKFIDTLPQISIL